MGQGPGMRKGSHHLGAWSSSMSQSPSWTGPRQNLGRKKESHQLGAELSDMSQSPFRTRNCQKRVTSPWWCLQRCVTMPSAGWGKAKELNHLGFGVSNMSQWPLWAGPRSGELHNVGYRCGAQWYITMPPISSAKAGGQSDITWV